MKKKDPGFATRAIHQGYRASENLNALTPPVHLTSTFVFDSAEEASRILEGEKDGFLYSRLGNPTLKILEERLSSLEGSEDCVVMASGMGAIASVFWSLLSAGDEILVSPVLYGCTHTLLYENLSRFGITIRSFPLEPCPDLKNLVSEKTRLVYLETPANPTLRLFDIAGIAHQLENTGIQLVVDSTFSTPYLCRPLEHGADLIVHSATKYLGGHGDLLAGAVLGRQEQIQKIRNQGLKDCTGSVLSPFAANLLLRGLKTLHLRMPRHSDSALTLAQFLESHPKVSRVFYPGLPSHPEYELAQKQMNSSGGMISFELSMDRPGIMEFLNRLQLIQCAVSLGDAESLIQHPDSMTHIHYSAEAKLEAQITPGLVRLSVGLEDAQDLLSDLKKALG